MNEFYHNKFSYTNSFLIISIIIFTLQLQSIKGHYVQWEYHDIPRPIPKIIPSEIMVDITNDLSYKILYFHSISNRNNIAFSPTALVSVLIALYEGSSGRSALEIKHILGLPGNRDICRIGYRDIHRRLKTYFFEQDNPLVGLSLNKENVTITPEYEAILKFYGYDLGIDMISSTPAPVPEPDPTKAPPKQVTETPAPAETTTTKAKQEETTFMNLADRNDVDVTEMTTAKKLITTETVTEPITTTEILTTQKMPITTTTEPTTTEPITTTQAATTTTTATEAVTLTTTEQNPPTTTETTTIPPQTTQTIPPTTTETMPPPTTTESMPITTTTVTDATTDLSTESTTESTESTTSTTMYIRTFKPNLITQAQSAALRINPGKTIENYMFPPIRRSTRFGSNMQQIPFMATSSVTTSRQIRNRSKRHYLGGFDYGYGNGFYGSHLQTSNLNHGADANVYLAFIPASVSAIDTQQSIAKEFGIYDGLDIGNLNGYDLDKSYVTPKETSKDNVINHIFYLNPQETIQTQYKTYNSILNYKYLDELKMSVLEMELDSNDYNLVIILPDFNVDMDTAIASLKIAPTLRLLRKQLKPRWVQAIIPDFQMKGNIYLTNDLQNMGINDVFEPSRADFTPMSDSNGIYVKHIEQSIKVHIRTRPIDQIKRNIARQYRPIEVAVNHPFLFFIVDKELDVALMSGKILNPLNVRIQ